MKSLKSLNSSQFSSLVLYHSCKSIK